MRYKSNRLGVKLGIQLLLCSMHNTASTTGSNQLLDKLEDYVLLSGRQVKSMLNPSLRNAYSQQFNV